MSTPARRQYLGIKERYPDALLAYQVGDFFEFFDDDARVASAELQIALTARGYGPEERVPLAGVPLHALETYMARLVARGHRVAICEQVGPAGRGLVERAVTRTFSPGTVTEPGMLPATRDTYLAAVAFGRRDAATGLPTSAGLAYVDASTGAFACAEWAGEALPDGLRAELQRLAPAEILISEHGIAPSNGRMPVRDGDPGGHGRPPMGNGRLPDAPMELDWLEGLPLSRCPEGYFDAEGARIRLCRHFATPTLAPFGCERAPLAATAAGAILAYLERMNPALLRLLTGLRTYDTSGYVEIDGRTWRALEVIEPAHGQRAANARTTRPATLLATLDATRTTAGARLLRRTLLQPLRDRAGLEERLDAVAELHARPALRERLGAALAGLADMERLTARVVHGAAVPRELHALAATLGRVPEAAAALKGCEAPALARLRGMLDACADVRAEIAAAVADPHAGGGRLLRPGHSDELDALVASVADSRRWIAALEGAERERTGIKSLKVGYNKVFGYSIEVTRPNLAKVPAEYIRKQTVATGERFVTAELKEHEARLLAAEERIEALERSLYLELLGRLAERQARLRATAAALAQADVWLALAEVAVARGYVRPELTDDTSLEIVGGRHPIVEATPDGAEFIANDAALDGDEGREDGARVVLLTGPNMAGKSTYLRQVATIALMAQVGSFVPAERARVGLVDRIFTRVGAEDDLARGLSTFMLEMVETAYILRHATSRSLVILDEVGRGTSATDGVALARAVVEHLHDRVGARTLFATHYHELAGMARGLPRLRVARMAVAERDGEAIFLHRVVPGASEASYGVQVARMAGLPASVTARAADLLAENLSPGPSPTGGGGPRAQGIAEGQGIYSAIGSDPEEAAGAMNRAPTAAGGLPGAVSIADQAEQHATYLPGNPQSARASFAARGHPGANAFAGLLATADPAADHPTVREVVLALASLNVAATTPMEAINLLFALQQRALAALRAEPAGARVGRE